MAWAKPKGRRGPSFQQLPKPAGKGAGTEGSAARWATDAEPSPAHADATLFPITLRSERKKLRGYEKDHHMADDKKELKSFNKIPKLI